MKNFLNQKTFVIAAFLFSAALFQAAAQNSDIVSLSGDFTTIYTLGNASEEMKIPDATAVGAYFSSPTVPAKKNGFYTVANLYTTFKPFPWLEAYFKLYAIDRPGSLYLPLELEPNAVKSLVNDLSLDSVYGRVSVFEAINLNLPVELFLKAGRYKAQASHFGQVSKYYTEQLLYLQNTKTDLTYEIGVGFESPNITISAATNYLLDESVQRYYDEDGMLDHGNLVLNKYAPQIIAMAKLANMEIAEKDKLSAELLYGYNVAGIYSGHSAGFSGRYTLNEVTAGLSIPIGLSFVLYEKNIDLLGRSSVLPSTATGKGSMDFRTSWSVGLGTGIAYSQPDLFDLDFNLAGTFNMIKHYYRTDLPVVQLSVDTLFTLKKYFFVGGGFYAGTLMDAEWKTRDETAARSKEDFNHTFTFANNLGYEVYAGVNFGDTGGKFVVGFNQNKGLSLNHMLEAKPEGQMKYKQEGTEWNFSDKLVEAGGLYFKFLFKF